MDYCSLASCRLVLDNAAFVPHAIVGACCAVIGESSGENGLRPPQERNGSGAAVCCLSGRTQHRSSRGWRQQQTDALGAPVGRSERPSTTGDRGWAKPVLVAGQPLDRLFCRRKTKENLGFGRGCARDRRNGWWKPGRLVGTKRHDPF